MSRQCHLGWMCVFACVWVRSQKDQREAKWVGGCITGRRPDPLQWPAFSFHSCMSLACRCSCDSLSVFTCRFYLHACIQSVCLCVNSNSKFSRSVRCPLLILSQNGCCQAEKLPNGALMGHNVELIASNVKSQFLVFVQYILVWV